MIGSILGLQETDKSKRLNQEDVMRITRENIMFLSGLKNCGVITGSDSNKTYQSLMEEDFVMMLETNILDLTQDLVALNKKVLKRFK
jgi:hypothetical protein